jgi:FlaG/FlaF family flagellin (archaellin)
MHQWHPSLARSFDTIEAVAAESTLVVRGQAGAQFVEYIGDVPFTVTDVAVTEVIAGSYGDASLRLRQFGDSLNASEDLESVLVAGNDYLLYLKPFTFERDLPTGQWVTVGGVSSWEEQNPSEYIHTVQDSGLPVDIDRAEVEQSVQQ